SVQPVDRSGDGDGDGRRAEATLQTEAHRCQAVAQPQHRQQVRDHPVEGRSLVARTDALTRAIARQPADGKNLSTLAAHETGPAVKGCVGSSAITVSPP